SYPTTGSTGEIFDVIKKLGHKIEPLSPALTAVLILDYPFAGIEGVSVPETKITVVRDGKKLKSHTGDILFTFKGLTGPGILDFSRAILPGDELNISFIGDVNEEAFRLRFIETIAKSAGKTIKNVMRAFGLPQSLNEKLLKLNGIPNDRKAAELNKKDRAKLIKGLSAFSLSVRELEGYNRAMTTRGGVALKEVNPKTMESRIVPGLFFAGEVLDVDGDTGGFNLQAAFSTGRMAGLGC
ncbi:MAG: aminoacetone oxidase family FAD-binding enzyme, partial [Chlorobi bacterium]|nr:aminoacetone oxidase family FAD-binding enzyme [Chlorobiota bacterium]